MTTATNPMRPNGATANVKSLNISSLWRARQLKWASGPAWEAGVEMRPHDQANQDQAAGLEEGSSLLNYIPSADIVHLYYEYTRLKVDNARNFEQRAPKFVSLIRALSHTSTMRVYYFLGFLNILSRTLQIVWGNTHNVVWLVMFATMICTFSTFAKTCCLSSVEQQPANDIIAADAEHRSAYETCNMSLLYIEAHASNMKSECKKKLEALSFLQNSTNIAAIVIFVVLLIFF